MFREHPKPAPKLLVSAGLKLSVRSALDHRTLIVGSTHDDRMPSGQKRECLGVVSQKRLGEGMPEDEDKECIRCVHEQGDVPNPKNNNNMNYVQNYGQRTLH